MVMWAAVLLMGSFVVLSWCSATLVRANPTRRLPGKAPAVQQPASYMWVGMLGIALGVLGGVALAGGPDAVAWLVTAVVIAAGLVPAQVAHNRRLRR